MLTYANVCSRERAGLVVMYDALLSSAGGEGGGKGAKGPNSLQVLTYADVC
jgi:hypothetical protein